ncbi:hypothetical protein [Streptomyces sp. SPB162]|uniref:hypothetical protein n=1 Tax=Streptomyces sp. SPB162 TaxID=2940560 RepID=UPI002405192F|nr:hypothetical protein [Streptomyces sp. SPB162]MDF9811472.1 hypothetical protein [Streptomyces sp. SPB162]
MLHNWYFCASLGLPVEDAAVHQDIIAALGEPRGVDRAEELVCAALDCLRSAETAATLHALPHVLAAHRRFQGNPEVTARALVLYRTIARISPDHLRVRFGALLREAGGGEWEKAARLLESALEEVLTRSHATAPGLVPYLDLGEQLAPTLVLTVGRFLASHRSQVVRERLGERPTVLVAALRGEHGRLALTQAAEWSATTWPESGDEVRALARASGGALDMEPDLLMCAARVSFGILPEERDPSVLATRLDEMENEALSGTRLLGWVEEFTAAWDWRSVDATARRQAAYTRLGGVAGHRDSAMPAVLWQNALSTLAVELAPEETVERLQRWWQPPEAFPDTNQAQQVQVSIKYTGPEYGRAVLHVGRLLGLRTPPDGRRRPMPILTDGPVADTVPAVAAQVWSPWMFDRPGVAASGGGPTRLTDNEPEQLVRLLGAGLLGERLLTDGRRRENHPNFLLLLNIHLRDVLGRRFQKLMGAIREHTGRSLVPAGHLAGLMAHAQNMTDRVGKGLRPTVHPAELVRVLSSLHAQTDPLPPGQALRDLAHEENGLAAALFWVRESSAGGVGGHRTEAGGRWFIGDRSAAEVLFDLVSAQPGSATRGTAITAALLRREISGGEQAPLSWREVHGDEKVEEPLFRWDWTPGGLPVPPVRNPSGKSVVPGHRELLLSGPTDPERRDFSVEEWEVMGQEMERRCEGSPRLRYVPLTARTLRLSALLRRPDLGDQRHHDDWVTSWSESVAALNSAAALPRVVRSRLLDLFRAEVAGAGSQERLSAVLERVIDVIIELSPRATLYYDRLFRATGDAMSLPAESANLLRHRVLRAFYHQWGPSVFAASRSEPFDTFGSRISARGTESALVTLVRATAHQELQAAAVPLGAVMAEAWERAQRPARLGARREELDAVTLDPRLVVAATVDRRTGEAVLYPRGEQLDKRVRGGGRPSVRDLFSPGSDTPQAVGGGFVLGVIASAVHTRGETHLWINCGLPNPVSHTLQPTDRRWTMGRTLAVKVGPDGRTADAVAWLAVPEPRIGEIRNATLRTTESFPWLSLRVDGVDGVGGDCYPQQSAEKDISARRLWDPDLSRRFGSPGRTWSTRTLVVWHGEHRHWVPLDAGPWSSWQRPRANCRAPKGRTTRGCAWCSAVGLRTPPASVRRCASRCNPGAPTCSASPPGRQRTGDCCRRPARMPRPGSSCTRSSRRTEIGCAWFPVARRSTGATVTGCPPSPVPQRLLPTATASATRTCTRRPCSKPVRTASRPGGSRCRGSRASRAGSSPPRGRLGGSRAVTRCAASGGGESRRPGVPRWTCTRWTRSASPCREPSATSSYWNSSNRTRWSKYSCCSAGTPRRATTWCGPSTGSAASPTPSRSLSRASSPTAERPVDGRS